MKEISKTLKNNYKLIVGVLIGLVLSVGSVYALDNIAAIDSEEVSYDNTESHGDYENVQKSIDELYERSGVSTTEWKDPILNGADPVLNEGLIPVTIDSDGKVKYANFYIQNGIYGYKRWANAVILVSSPSKEYTTGDVILEQDIESYFVWIPRYKYKVWDKGEYISSISFSNIANVKDDSVLDGKYAVSNMFGHARTIDVVFGDTTNVAEGNDAKKSGTSGDTSVNVDEYLIHPAFTLGDTELNGIWVGKFETGYKDAKTKEDAQKTEQDSKKIIIKPNVYSWRNNTVKNFFMSAYKYKEELKSHMMKNTEWGAVAYLSHSSYGIGGEININNNNTYKTGYSSYNVDQSTYKGTESTGDDGKSKEWNTSTGYLASTTGNITGVYDMSGGAWEYVAGYRVGTTEVTDSGFEETEIIEKYKDYIDKYDSSSDRTTYNKRILGDATGELGPFYYFKDGDDNNRNHNSWYSDGSYFIGGSYPWFTRGGLWDDGVLASQFYFGWATGGENANGTFRLVLSISE